jgi:hypothetical protein
LELQFHPKPGIDVGELKLSVTRKDSMDIHVMRGKTPADDDVIHKLVPISMEERREESKASLDALFSSCN